MINLYNLREIKNSKDKDFVQLMKLYSDHMNPVIKTDTREISYWLDKQNNYTNLFGYYRNEQLIGYCHATYLESSKILFIDYIVIDNNNDMRVFNDFAYSIQDYFKSSDLDINYIVTEVPYFSYSNTPSNRAIALIRRLKMINFKVVKAEYFQPDLGSNKEGHMQAVLLINSNNSVITEIKNEMYLTILNSIYYEHYYHWYSEFLKGNELTQYRLMLDNILIDINKKISKKTIIKLNGYSHLVNDDKNEMPDYEDPPKWGRIMTYVIIFLLITGFTFLTFRYVSLFLGINIDELYFAASFASVIFFIYYN